MRKRTIEMNVCSITYGTVVLLIIQLFSADALPMSLYEKRKYPHHIEAQGLYDGSDKVTILTKAIFNENVFNQEFGSMVEFYNAFCGFCIRYAPTWKEFAADVHAWQGVVQVAAVDCSVDDNNDLCRKFEVMAYPTVRYFPPHYADLPKHFGVNTEGHNSQSLRKQLVEFVRNETNSPSHWPNLKAVIDTHANALFSQLPNSVELIFLIYSHGNATVATEVILDLHAIKRISIRHVESNEIAANFGMLGPSGLAVINRNLEIVQLLMKDINRAEIRVAISQFVDRRGLSDPVETTSQSNHEEDNMNSLSPSVISERNQRTVSHVKQYEPEIYQADLELALRYTLFHEIPKFGEIQGERLLALQRYINVVNRYSPLGHNGRQFMQELQVYVMEARELRGEHFEGKVKQLETKWLPMFSSDHWIGCQGSVAKLRGFTCGLWTLFHFMSVQAADSELSNDPLETLQAIHGYVKYFFGCTDCSQHFQEMATKDRIWSVPSKDDAVLWLWIAHNQVNDRLKGDHTEDPQFPKIQFPSATGCPSCRRVPVVAAAQTSNHSVDGLEWDKMEVLLFMKRIYAPQNVSRYGINDETVLPKTMEALREKRLLENVFSDMDMRMGLLLYLFCICMMILAVKLFVQRGYRKKMYSHDFMGKV